MKTHLLSLSLTLLTLIATSQIRFEPGYFIDNSDTRVECLIKNEDWKSNPTDFTYKLSEGAEEQKADIVAVQEFGIGDEIKFIRSIVNIDRSSTKASELSFTRNPEFKAEELFLKVLVEGEYSLYFYRDSNLFRYFFGKKDAEKIDQLVYKKYEIDERKIRENNFYKQQLINNLKCTTITSQDVESLTYTRRSLANFFIKYNQCLNPDFIAKNSFEEEKAKLRWAIRPRFRSSSLSVAPGFAFNPNFGPNQTLAMGMELEFLFPSKKGGWAVVIEPVYQSFVEKTSRIPSAAIGNVVSKLNYKSVEIHSSVRHYFSLTKNSKLFVNGSIVTDFATEFSITYEDIRSVIDNRTREASIVRDSIDTVQEFRTLFSLAWGIGFELNNRFILEGRYASRSDIRKVNKLDYKSYSLIFGYRI